MGGEGGRGGEGEEQEGEEQEGIERGEGVEGEEEGDRKGGGGDNLNEVTGSLGTYNEPCTLNCEYSRELNRFIPLKPWQGGPPQRSSTSLFWGRTCPLELVVEPCREGRKGEGGEERRREERRGKKGEREHKEGYKSPTQMRH